MVVPLSLQGVDMVATILDVDPLGGEEARGAQSHVSIVGKLGTVPLHVLIPSRRPNDAWQQPNLLDPMLTVGQPSHYSCQAV